MTSLIDKLTGGKAEAKDKAAPVPAPPKLKPPTKKALGEVSAISKELVAALDELELTDPYLVDAMAFAKQADAMVDRYMKASGGKP
jgi:hypothetical protein